jgi:hypothetical protein
MLFSRFIAVEWKTASTILENDPEEGGKPVYEAEFLVGN